MEFEIPEWLTKEFLENALENGNQYKVTIEDLKIDMPIAKGNNYACDIFRAEFRYKKLNDCDKLLNESLIIKAPKTGPIYEEMVKFGILEKEPIMYYEFSPKLKSVLEMNNEIYEHILPESYSTEKENVLILENLKSKGYNMVDRLKRLDFDHSVLALKSLAKFHAGSVIVQEKYPEVSESVGKEIMFKNEGSDLNEQFMVMVYKIFMEEMKSYPELEKYFKWFERNVDNFYHSTAESVERKDNELNVLNHGDFWLTNMLFKYDDDNVPIKVKIIDLQICRFTSPVIDLMYFIDGSVQEDIRKERFEDLINVYLNELNSNLDELGSSKRLEKSEFERLWKERAYFKICVILTILPFCIAELKPSEMIDMKELNKEDFTNVETNPMKGYFKNEKYMRIISKRLEELEKIGLISAE